MRFLKILGSTLVCTTYLVWGGIVLLVSKNNNVGPIYKGLRFFLRHSSYQKTVRILREDRDFDEMIRTRYRMGQSADWGYLNSLPTGTLGKSFAVFMSDQAITPIEKLPENNVQIDPETDYMRSRIRFIHDIHHVICGYPASPIGEVQISAFYVAQIESPLNMVVMAVGILKATLFAPEKIKDVIAAISDGWHLGLKSLPVFGVKYEEMWEEPLTSIRSRLNLASVNENSEKVAV